MEIMISDVSWLPVIVGAVVAYVLGGLWYSEKVFAKVWKAGIGTPAVPNTPMSYGMLAQAVGTFLLSWTIGVAELYNSLALSVLVVLTVASLIKANDLYSGKSKSAIAVETTFILVMVLVMILTHWII